MKKKWFLLLSVLSISSVVLAGCSVKAHTRLGDEEHNYEYDKDSGAFVEINEFEDCGYDSSDEAIKALWQAYVDCSKEEFLNCLPNEGMVKKGADLNITEQAQDLTDHANEVKDTVVIHVADIEIDSEKCDVDDLGDEYAHALDIEKAMLCQVKVPMTRTIAGSEYEIKDCYEMITARISGRWFVLHMDATDTEIISGPDDTVEAVLGDLVIDDVKDDKEDPSGGLTHMNGGSVEEWCDFVTTETSMTVTYTKGISDLYEIAEGASFGDLCDGLSSVSDDFNKDTYRRVVSLYFWDSSYYEKFSADDPQAKCILLAALAEVAHTIDRVDGDVSVMRINAASTNTVIFDMECLEYGSCSLYVVISTGEMTLYQYETGNTSDGKIKDEAVAEWVVPVLEVFRNEFAN